jgi:hypothetical protein
MALGGLVASYATIALRPGTGAPLWEAQAIFTAYWLMFEVFDILQADSWLLPLNAAVFLCLSLMKWQCAYPEHIWKLLAAVSAGLSAADWWWVVGLLVLGLILMGVSWVYSRFRDKFTADR